MDKFAVLFIIVIFYVLLLLIIRHFKIGSKESCINCNNCCPDCKLALNRIRRLNNDKLLRHFTFKIFEFKRYYCNECGWKGLRWENRYTANNK